MNWILFALVLLGMQMICVWVGGKASRSLKTNTDYFLASKTVRFFPLMMTLVATQVGGGLVLGSAQEAYTHGWSVLLYPLGQSLGFILLACGIGKKMAESGVSTVAELCERAFGSKKLRKIASLLSIVSLFMIFVAQIIASKKFMVSLGFNDTWIFLGFWALTIFYTVAGGLKGVIATDIIQALFFIAVFVIALFCIDTSTAVTASSLPIFDGNFDNKMLGWLMMPLLFMAIEQDMGQRCFAANDPKTVTKATFFAALLTFAICCIPVYFGVLAQSMGLQIEEGGSVFMTFIQKATNPSVTALIACAVIAAIISTAISLINAISSNLTLDFDWRSNKNGGSIKVAQAITTGIALSGIIFSFYFDNIVNVLIQSYDLSLSCLFIPVMVALLKGRGSATSAWISFAAGAVAFVLFRVIPYEAPKEILCILFSGVGYLVGEYLFASKKEPLLDR